MDECAFHVSGKKNLDETFHHEVSELNERQEET